MPAFFVNGKKEICISDKPLLRFLRDDLRLTSVKDGCSEGACGSCTVIIDGKPVKACTILTSEAEGKNIITVEGLSEYEKEVYTYSFGKAGAVQCGFCIPGMVLCAKSLLDKVSDPDEKQIRHAIRNNICRCTGYVKIVKAIKLAAEILRNDAAIADDSNWKIGESVPRVDVKDKVTGTGKYPDDLYFDNMAHVVAVRSEYPRAKVLEIDTSIACEANGVIGIYTAADIPGNIKVGHLKRDWDTMIGIGGITRYTGDVICLVVAQSREDALKASELVKVKYEVLPFVSNPYEAMKEDAPLVHEEGNLLGHVRVKRGNVQKALEESRYVITKKYSTPWTEHAFLEPETAVSVPLENGAVKIYSADQGVYDTRRETAPMLNLPEQKVLVENCYVGGGFGGKEDVTVQHLSALAAILCGQPCKMKLSRQESLTVHPKRHPMDMEFTMGCDSNGKILGVKAKIIADTGAYASLGMPVLQRACTHASGPYNYRNFEIDGYSYYTNNPPAGAFRGFGVTQSCFGIESLLNEMADKIGISHWNIRYLNAIRPGQEMPNGQIADKSTGLAETLLAVKDDYFAAKYAGIACAMKNAGVGVGIPDTGRVRLEVKNGKVIIHCGGSCIGQGMCTVLKQIVCDVSGLDSSLVEEEKANTFNAPDSGTTSGSRHTTITGEAAARAALKLKEALSSYSLKELENRDFYAEYLAKTDEMGSAVKNPKSHIAYGFATHVCILNETTHKIDRLIAAHEVGRAINPVNVQGQIEGGVVMGLGFALREKFEIKDCRVTETFGSLGLFRADELPEIKAVIVEKAGLEVSSGAIGIGEITSIPTAPAVADAYFRLDGNRRYSLPVNNTPYENSQLKSQRKVKTLVVDNSARCIGCMECVHTCARTYSGTLRIDNAYLKIREKQGVGNQSGISGIITRPVVCTQCGICAKACPIGAITANGFGVYTIDSRMCNNCGKCREACPFGLIPESVGKCTACGLCVQICPTGVLTVSEIKSQDNV